MALSTHYSDDLLFGPNMLSGLSANNLTKSLGRETRATLVYTAKSTFNRIILSHFRQPVIARILPPTEQKDKNDDKSFPPTISDSRLQGNDGSATTSALS